MKTLTTALLLTLAAGSAGAQDRSCHDKPVPDRFEGTAFVVDGDTIASAGRPRIRLWGVQAPELRDKQTGQETRAGMVARAAMADMLDGPVACRPLKWDRYCRVVATCGTKHSPDLSAAMLARGMAYTFMLDDRQGLGGDAGDTLAGAYARAETDARRSRVGLWKEWLP
jgi:endonuclease YncB( thermonuclease family)